MSKLTDQDWAFLHDYWVEAVGAGPSRAWDEETRLWCWSRLSDVVYAMVRRAYRTSRRPNSTYRLSYDDEDGAVVLLQTHKSRTLGPTRQQLIYEYLIDRLYDPRLTPGETLANRLTLIKRSYWPLEHQHDLSLIGVWPKGQPLRDMKQARQLLDYQMLVSITQCHDIDALIRECERQGPNKPVLRPKTLGYLVPYLLEAANWYQAIQLHRGRSPHYVPTPTIPRS